jgi:hypothetical protein
MPNPSDFGAPPDLAVTLCTDPVKVRPIAATASSSWLTHIPDLAYDGDPSTAWNSGTWRPGWIQLDLGKAMSICKIRLLVGQVPDGPTHHVVSAGIDPSSLSDVYTVAETTLDGHWIELCGDGNGPNADANKMDNVRYVKVLTVESVSWVEWREIELYATASGAH